MKHSRNGHAKASPIVVSRRSVLPVERRKVGLLLQQSRKVVELRRVKVEHWERGRRHRRRWVELRCHEGRSSRRDRGRKAGRHRLRSRGRTAWIEQVQAVEGRLSGRGRDGRDGDGWHGGERLLYRKR